MIPYTFIKSSTNLTVYINGKSYIADTGHVNHDKILGLIYKGSNGDDSILIGLFDTTKAIRSYVGEAIKISDDGVVLHDGVVVDDILTTKILTMMSGGFNINPMTMFLRNLKENPSSVAQQELMLFMAANDMPITPDGHLLAYKSVKQDYMDGYTGKISNAIGQVCSMPRLAVDDDRERTCSNGLHFAAKEYAGTFISSGHLMVLKIHPRDVVAIPSDYHNQKGRCCRYEVIGEVAMSAADRDKYNTVPVYEESDDDYKECEECGASMWYTDDECPDCGCEY